MRTSIYRLMAVSLPDDWYSAFNRICHLPLLGCHTIRECLTLLLSGDIESNSGPKASDNADILVSVLSIVKRIEQGQSTIFEELRQLRDKPEKTYGIVPYLSSRVSALKAELLELRNTREVVDASVVPSEVSGRLTEIMSRCDDAENRLRCCISLFYGMKDEPNESLKTSERKAIDFCESQLDLTLNSVDIERPWQISWWKKIDPLS